MKGAFPYMESSTRTLELFVPGRLCLFGEHSDWAGRYTSINAAVHAGYAIVTGIDLGLYATATAGERFHVTTQDETGESLSINCEMSVDTLRGYAAEGGYFAYMCGVAAYMCQHYHIGGINIHIEKNTLPIKKGLSSSAAVCVLTARAFNELYQLKMSVSGEMQAAYRGEMLTPSRCGRLDQACAYGVRPVCMEFDGDEINVEKLKVGKDLYWVFADLMAQKNTVKILSDLNKCYPFPQNEIEQKVHQALGPDNKNLIQTAKRAIAAGDAEAVGRLMTEAQQLFDAKVAPACPQELTAPKLHAVLADPHIQALTYGGKGVGSQGDGTVQFIARDKDTQQTLIRYLTDALGLDAHPFTLHAKDRITKAVIPLAGYATRMYPASRFVRKAFMPVVDPGGVVKPVILYLLEELDAAGIEEIALIVGEDDFPEYQKLFDAGITEDFIAKLPEKVREYERLIARLAGKLRYVVQKERRGFGHAVFQARDCFPGEAVLLLLGDFVYRSNLSMSCVEQTLGAYMKTGGQLTVAIKRCPLEQVIHYGILTGVFDDRRNYLMRVADMVEKPSVDYAEEHLAVNGSEYYSTFGAYVLTPDVFNHLEQEIAENDGTTEISLTNALQAVCLEKGMTGVYIDGQSYDVGIPKAYRETIREFGQ